MAKELSDILYHIFKIATAYKIDLEKAFLTGMWKYEGDSRMSSERRFKVKEKVKLLRRLVKTVKKYGGKSTGG